MIRHCVMFRLVADADAAKLKATLTGLADLVGALDGCTGFQSGPNRDFENMSSGFDMGFFFDARDPATLKGYREHPTHLALAGDLVELCEGAAAGIMVFDIETSV